MNPEEILNKYCDDMEDIYVLRSSAIKAIEEVLKQKDELLKALKRINDPIDYMIKNLKEGVSLNGYTALQLSQSHEYLKSITKFAITKAEER